jgi:N-acetylglucosamine kinase-like BadF-type ATPase
LETALAAAELEHGAPGKSGHFGHRYYARGDWLVFLRKKFFGQARQVGGWGHLLGDKGSAYEIGLRAFKATVYYYDRDGELSLLGRNLMRALMLNELDEASAWAVNATKAEIAALAPEVFSAASRRDKIARDVLEGAAHSIA